MVTDAEAHAAEDKEKREQIEVKNRGDMLAYETEKNLKELSEKMDGADRAKVENALAELRRTLEGGRTEEIRTATDALNQTWGEVSQRMYAGAGQGPGGPGGGPEGGQGPVGGESPGGPQGGKKEGGDGAVDADFEVVK